MLLTKLINMEKRAEEPYDNTSPNTISMIMRNSLHFTLAATLWVTPFLTRGYAKRRNGFLWGLRYANVSLAHSGVESS